MKAIFRQHSAKFHSTCRLQFSKSRLQRAVKRKHSDDQSTSGCMKQQTRGERHTRTKIDTDCFVYLFCKKPGSVSEPLHEAMTCLISQKVRKCPIKLFDEGLMAKVSSGDLMASVAKYYAQGRTQQLSRGGF